MSQRAKRYRRLGKQRRALGDRVLDTPHQERADLIATILRLRKSEEFSMPEGLVTRELRDEPRRAWSHVHRVNAVCQECGI